MVTKPLYGTLVEWNFSYTDGVHFYTPEDYDYFYDIYLYIQTVFGTREKQYLITPNFPTTFLLSLYHHILLFLVDI